MCAILEEITSKKGSLKSWTYRRPFSTTKLSFGIYTDHREYSRKH